ncbi:MAG TPA: hypothetical protein VMB72_15025 [Acidimicrobiales bacterium]|nr:hypothetical protein [Acidimicrobiales bacterium]
MADAPFDVAGFLSARRQALVDGAEGAVGRRDLAHYRAAGTEVTRARLEALFDVVVTCCAEHRLEPALDYGTALAVERHADGHALGEVQTVINIVEEALWRAVLAEVPADAQGYALGLVSTALGAVKDRLACAYVSEVSARPMVSLDLSSLFEGREGDVHPL